MNKRARIISVILTALLVVVLSLVAYSCNGLGNNSNNGNKTNNELLPTLEKIRIVPALYGHNGDEESDVCLSMEGGVVEKFILEITLSNPDKYAVLSFDYNDVTFESDRFSRESTPAFIQVKNLSAPVKEGEFEIKIDDIVYQKKSGTGKVLGLKNNVKKVKIQPTFNLTLDFSEANLPEGDSALKVVQNDFLSRLELPYSQDMNDFDSTLSGKTYGRPGYIFDGWYTLEGGEGDRYTELDHYTFYKDVTLYAHYARAFKYSLEENYLVITGLTPEGQNTAFPIDIPSEIDGVPVRKIGYMAFSGIGSNKTFILPNSVVEIGDYAFSKCTGLKIDLGAVERIGTSAFDGAGKITLGKNGLFLISEATLPNTLKEIGALAFRGCSWDTRVQNPYNTSSFRSENTLLLPSSVEKIGNKAFMESGFQAVYFHTDAKFTTETLGESVFDGSKNLTSICLGYKFNETGEVINRNASSGVIDLPLKAFYNCTSLKTNITSNTTNLRLSEGLKTIGELAFASSGEGMKDFTYVSFPKSLEIIGKQAFANTGLTTVIFPTESNLKTLEAWCFENAKFEEITLYSLSKYGQAPFWGNTKLKAINILTPNVPTYEWSLTVGLSNQAKYYVKKDLLSSYRASGSSWQNNSACDNVFAYDFITTDINGTKFCYEPVDDNGNLDFRSTNVRIASVFDTTKEITILKSFAHNGTTFNVTSVGKYFVHDGVYQVRLPSTLQRIEEYAFFGCKSLEKCVWVKDNIPLADGNYEEISLKYIGDYAFQASGITSFYSSNSLKYIGEEAFRFCPNLTKVVLDKGDGITIMDSAFTRSGIVTLVIGMGVSRINNYAFQNNEDLSVVYIGLRAVPQTTSGKYPAQAGAPLGYCPNISVIYVLDEASLQAFTSLTAPDGYRNGWTDMDSDNSTDTKYRVLSGGSWPF